MAFTAWNELCRGPEIIWYGPVFLENTNIPRGTARYREVPRSRHVTCRLGDRIRICSDSDFFRDMENQISGHVIDKQRTKVMIFIYSPRFAENTDVLHTRHVVRLTHLTRYDPSLNRICTVRHSIARFSRTKSHDTTRITREIPWYTAYHAWNSMVR